MSGVLLQKENGKLVVRCSSCGELIENTTEEVTKLFETGKLKKVSSVCLHCEAKAKFSVQFLGKEYG